MLGFSRRRAATLRLGHDRDGLLGLRSRARCPAGRAVDVPQPNPQTCGRTPITGDSNVFTSLQGPDVERVDLLGEAVVRAEHLGLEAAEQPVPDDQDAA